MATFKYATKELSISNAKAFSKAVNATDTESTKNSIILYAAIGKSSDWTSEPSPDTVIETDHGHRITQRNFIGAKRITPADVSHVTDRYDWESGTVYPMYRNNVEALPAQNFFVVTSDMNVYKCLFNNKAAASTVKPTGLLTDSFETSDGYVWKYMYTINLGDAEKFFSSVHVPVKNITGVAESAEDHRQLSVQNAAVDGSIDVIETNIPGVGYKFVDEAAVEDVPASDQLRIAGSDVATIENIYNGSSVYVVSGTGAGGLRRIVDWNAATKVLTVNTAFTTLPSTDSVVTISPTVTIVGDGSGAQAYSKVNAATGAIDKVTMVNRGINYTCGSAFITSNTTHGSGATANVVISPAGGHGSDAVRELGGDRLCLNVSLEGVEGNSATGKGYIPTGVEFRSLSILKDPILKVDSANAPSAPAVATTLNSPKSLRLTTKTRISYQGMVSNLPANPISAKDILTNRRNALAAELGTLEFVTEMNPDVRRANALSNALQGANAEVVFIEDDENSSDVSLYHMYINNVNSYSNYAPFTKDDIILKKDSSDAVAVIEAIDGPEANTHSGEVLYTEHVRAVTRAVGQSEDIKIILDF